MKWCIDSHYMFEDAREAAEHIVENCDDSYYDDVLDECHPMVNICGYEYCPSDALYRIDPIAYRCGRSDWEDFTADDIAYQLERMSDGEVDCFYGFEVLCEEEEEEVEEEEEESHA